MFHKPGNHFLRNYLATLTHTHTQLRGSFYTDTWEELFNVSNSFYITAFPQNLHNVRWNVGSAPDDTPPPLHSGQCPLSGADPGGGGQGGLAPPPPFSGEKNKVAKNHTHGKKRIKIGQPRSKIQAKTYPKTH